MAQASRTRRRRKTRLGILAVLMSVASAISLNDLQPIQDGLLPMACSLVYHATIQGCTAADFTSGQRCSSACRTGIRSIDQDVGNSCDTVDATPNSVLDFAQKGILIIEACLLNAVTLATTTTTTSTSLQTTTPPAIITASSSAKTSQSVGSFTIVPPASTTVRTTPIQSTAFTTSFTFVPPPSTSSTSKPSTTSALTTAVPQSATTSSTSSALTTATTSTSTATDGSGRGGGSPFDVTSSSPRLSASWSLCVPAGAALATLFLL